MDDAGMQHGEGSLGTVAEKPPPQTSRGRTYSLVRVHKKHP